MKSAGTADTSDCTRASPRQLRASSTSFAKYNHHQFSFTAEAVDSAIDTLLDEGRRGRRYRVRRKPKQPVDNVFYRDNLRLMHDPTE